MDTSLKRCPFCGQPNLCGVGQQGSCWCAAKDLKFPAELLELLPEEHRGKRCVCRGCVEAFHADPEHFRRTQLQR